MPAPISMTNASIKVMIKLILIFKFMLFFLLLVYFL